MQAGGKQKKRKKLTFDSRVESHIEVLNHRLKVIAESSVFRKIFSAAFFALVALIQNNGISRAVDPDYTFITLIQYIFKKHLSLIAKLQQPKEPVLALLPLLISKAIIIAFEQKIKESLSELIVCTNSTSN